MWGAWRLDWCPALRDVAYLPAPMVYFEKAIYGPLTQLVRERSMPAVRLEQKGLTEESGQRTLEKSFAAGAHEVLFARVDETFPPFPGLLQSVAAACMSLCWVGSWPSDTKE